MFDPRVARSLASAARRALRESLEAIPGAAAIVRIPCTIVEANAAADVLLERGRREILARIRSALTSEDVDTVSVTRLETPAADHVLAVIPLEPGDVEPRLAAAARRWRLTPREGAVLALLVRGFRNRAVARALRCTEATVVLHVSALLEKAGCESRAEVVAQFWSSW